MIPRNAPDLDTLFGSTKHADEARLILQYMFRVRIMLKSNEHYAPGISRESGWCPIRAKNLKAMLSNRYKPVLDRLIEVGVIELEKNAITGRKNYAPGIYTMKYRVVLGLISDKLGRKYRIEQIETPRLIAKILWFYRRIYRNQQEQFLTDAGWYSANLKFIDSIELIIESTELLGSDQLLGTAIQFNDGTGRFISQDDFAGRIHSHLCTLPKILRSYIKLKDDSDTLVIADVKSAQPYLISAILYRPKLIELIPEFMPILDRIKPFSDKPDVRMFYEDCASGSFYTKWMDATGLDKQSAKTSLFRHVFYSAASNHHADENVRSERIRIRFAFETLYPNVYCALTILKRTRKETLPFVYELTKRGKKEGRMYVTPNMIAQRLEVGVFIKLITKTCTDNDVITGTIHDAWIMKKSDLDSFLFIFKETFNQLGVKAPQLAIDELGLCNNNIELLHSGK